MIFITYLQKNDLMEIEKYKCADCDIKSKAVSILKSVELDALEKGCSQTIFHKGELLIKEGAPAGYIVYIRDGFVKICKKGIGNKDFILNISKKGAYLNIQNLNSRDKNYLFSAFAITETKVCFIDIESFGNLLKRNGTFALEVITYIFNDEMNYFDRLLNIIQQQLPGRLANALLYFKNQVYCENPFMINLTRTELASLIGTSRESVTRLIKEFHDTGIIRADKNKITVLDEKRLEDIKYKG